MLLNQGNINLSVQLICSLYVSCSKPGPGFWVSEPGFLHSEGLKNIKALALFPLAVPYAQ